MSKETNNIGCKLREFTKEEKDIIRVLIGGTFTILYFENNECEVSGNIDGVEYKKRLPMYGEDKDFGLVCLMARALYKKYK